MARDKSFHDYVIYDVLGNVRGITSRPMFSGWAIYQDGVVFGIIIGTELYFKVNDSNRYEFEKIDSHPFSYTKGNGQEVTMSYWLVPEEIMENREVLARLMETSVIIGKK